MKQILQHLNSGQILLQDVAAPAAGPGRLVVQTACSLISPGTERMLLDFGRAGWLGKARRQPEKVRQVLDKIRTDGLWPTVEAVRSKLDEPLPLGYSNVGRVLAVGEGVRGFTPGDRVVSNGPHAEVVCVPRNLLARIPDEVSDEAAAFTVLGAIALQGIRLVGPTLGECVAVFGLGLIGLVAVQILAAHGARVVGFDFDPGRVELARGFGAEAEDLSRGVDPVAAVQSITEGLGADGVLITAATQSDELIHQAARMCRRRGRIVLTGVTGLNLKRSDFYEKELSFQVSCSYGPGRYDPAYEQQGHDYPPGFVRWTEQRNFEAVLQLLRRKQLRTGPLVGARFPLADAAAAYETVLGRKAIAVLLTYGQEPLAPPLSDGRPALLARAVRHGPPRETAEAAVLGLVGAGGFTRQKILPALLRTGARLKWIASSTGVSGATAARKFAIEQSTTDRRRILDDPQVNAVVIATRHNTHARLVVEALKAGKSVFVEKPLCLTEAELDDVRAACDEAKARGTGRPILMVGYNRRFAPLIGRLRELLAGRRAPLAMTYTCNAGAIPAEHWTQDPAVGGGRILGEVCHFIDLLHFLAGESPVDRIVGLRHGPDEPGNLDDTLSLSLRFADGSLGQINYFANGSRGFPKERLEVFSEGRVFRLDNFRRLETHGCRGGRRSWRQDKGHDREFAAFINAIRTGGPPPIAVESLLHTARATLAAKRAVSSGGGAAADLLGMPLAAAPHRSDGTQLDAA